MTFTDKGELLPVRLQAVGNTLIDLSTLRRTDPLCLADPCLTTGSGVTQAAVRCCFSVFMPYNISVALLVQARGCNYICRDYRA